MLNCSYLRHKSHSMKEEIIQPQNNNLDHKPKVSGYPASNPHPKARTSTSPDPSTIKPSHHTKMQTNKRAKIQHITQYVVRLTHISDTYPTSTQKPNDDNDDNQVPGKSAFRDPTSTHTKEEFGCLTGYLERASDTIRKHNIRTMCPSSKFPNLANQN